jgi:hypothetical protein
MSRFSELAQAIRDLPEVDSKRAQLQTVKDIRQQALPILEGIRKASRQASYVEGLAAQGNRLTKLTEAAKQQMAAEAQKLVRLTDRNEFGGERAISNALDALKKALPRVSTAIQEAWYMVKNRAGSFQEIANIATHLSIEGAASVEKAIRDYSQATQSPPESQTDMDKIAAAAKRLEDSIAATGLEGKVRDFLLAAAKGEAGASKVLDEDIADFLGRHPSLWERLKVRLA